MTDAREINTTTDLQHMTCPNCGGREFKISKDAFLDGLEIALKIGGATPTTKRGYLCVVPVSEHINENETAVCSGCTLEADICTFDSRLDPEDLLDEESN